MAQADPPPPDPNALFRQAVSLQRSGELDRAIEIYRYLGAHFGRNAATLLMQGVALAQQGEPAQALACLDEAIRLAPDSAEAHYNKGEVLRQADSHRDAARCYEQAIRLKPAYGKAYFARGLCLAELGQPGEALQCLDRAVELDPEFAEAHLKRALVLAGQGRADEALRSYDRAIAVRPGLVDAWIDKGALLHDLERFGDALGCFDAALRHAPDSAQALYNKACCLRDLGRVDESVRCFDACIAADPQLVSAYWNKGLVKLLLGDYSEGWRLYEWRNRDPRKKAVRDYPQPRLWSPGDLAGRTVLVYHEQGFGDAIQFCRYVPLLRQSGARVVFEVPPGLVSLMRSLKCDCTVVGAGEPLPRFDAHCPAMSLPLVFGTTLPTIPAAVPYLFAEREKAALWERRLGPRRGLRVGLAWSTGHDERRRDIAEQKRRDIALSALRSLNVDGVDFHSLQVGAAAVAQLRALEAARWDGPKIVDVTEGIRDFSDTAALIENLDLVVSVCTSVAHLSGAMGRKTWVLLQQRADWRWLLERSDSPWYPTVTLFRQSAFNDWTNVVAEVRGRLAELVAGRHGAPR